MRKWESSVVDAVRNGVRGRALTEEDLQSAERVTRRRENLPLVAVVHHLHASRRSAELHDVVYEFGEEGASGFHRGSSFETRRGRRKVAPLTSNDLDVRGASTEVICRRI